jgi:hypothetical protein
MESEQRATTRKQISLNVLINCESFDLTYPRIWKTRDLSTNGAFVEMNRMDLSPHASIEAVLVLEYKDNHEPHCLPAEIVRISTEGIALHFGQYDDRTRSALMMVLEGK